MTSSAGIVGAERGRRFRFPAGNSGEVKADSSHGMALGFFVSTLPAGAGMPLLHRHSRIDEAFYVLEGTVEYCLGERALVAGAGDAVLVPAGEAHCFRSAGPGTAKIVVITSGPEGVDMVVALSEVASAGPDAMRAVLERFDTELLSPSPVWPNPSPE